MKKKYLIKESLPIIYDNISNEKVLLIGLDIRTINETKRYFFRLYDGNGIYKREIFIK